MTTENAFKNPLYKMAAVIVMTAVMSQKDFAGRKGAQVENGNVTTENASKDPF